MDKFKVLFLFFVLSIVTNIYFVTTRNHANSKDLKKFMKYSLRNKHTQRTRSRKKSNKKNPAQAFVTKNQFTGGNSVQVDSLPSKIKVEVDSQVDDSSKLEESFKEYEESMIKYLDDYREEAKHFLQSKLDAGVEAADLYFELSEKRQVAINDYINPKIKAHQEKKGVESPYFLSLDDQVNMAKINENYINKLKKKIGDEGYEKLQKMKQEYMEEAMKNGVPAFPLEF